MRDFTAYSGKWRGLGIAMALLALLLCDGAVTSAQASLVAEFFSPSDPMYSYTIRYDTLDQLITSLGNNPLQGQLQGFNQNTDQINVYSNGGGLAITLSAPANSSTFTVSIPGLGYTKTFSGADRAAGVLGMQVWATTDPDGVVGQVNARVQADALAAASGQSGGDGGCFISTIR